MTPFAIISLILQLAPAVGQIVTLAQTNEDIISKIKDLSKPLAGLLTEIGGELFPKAAPDMQLVGGVVAAFDPNLTKWLQGALNNLMGAGLKVDGIYGPRTRDAVSALQTKYGLKVDGVAGQVTQALIAGLLNKLPNLTPAPKPAA